MDDKYDYDVAFSFTVEDEDLVQKVNDLINGRLKTFIYTENQDILAGRDGEKIFSEIFSKKARIVVVFYRTNWGNTAWTRIEEIAIRNRAYEEGYDFTIFIPLDENPQVPKWLPKPKLWYGIKRWGIDGLAPVIEAKVQEYGGRINEKSYIDQADLIKKKDEHKRKIESLFKTEKGVNLANNEAQELISKIKEMVNTVIKKKLELKEIFNSQHRIVYTFSNMNLDFIWSNRFINVLNESFLTVEISEGILKIKSNYIVPEPKVIKKLKYSFDIDLYEGNGWKNVLDKKFFTSTKLIPYIFEEYFNIIDKNFG